MNEIEKICPFCQAVFPSNEIRAHIASAHLGIKPKETMQTVNNFTMNNLPLPNIQKVPTQPGKSYDCPKCGRQFKSFGGHRRHKCGPDAKRPLACKLCFRTFKNFQSLRFHAVAKHNNDPKSLEGYDQMQQSQPQIVPQNKCTYCPQQFQDRSQVQEHERVFHLGFHFACPTCPRKFRAQNELQRHVVVCNSVPKNEVHRNFITSCDSGFSSGDEKTAIQKHQKMSSQSKAQPPNIEITNREFKVQNEKESLITEEMMPGNKIENVIRKLYGLNKEKKSNPDRQNPGIGSKNNASKPRIETDIEIEYKLLEALEDKIMEGIEFVDIEDDDYVSEPTEITLDPDDKHSEVEEVETVEILENQLDTPETRVEKEELESGIFSTVKEKLDSHEEIDKQSENEGIEIIDLAENSIQSQEQPNSENGEELQNQSIPESNPKQVHPEQVDKGLESDTSQGFHESDDEKSKIESEVVSKVEKKSDSTEDIDKQSQDEERPIEGIDTIDLIENTKPQEQPQSEIVEEPQNQSDLKQVEEELESEKSLAEEKSKPELEKICPFCQDVFVESEIKGHIASFHLGIIAKEPIQTAKNTNESEKLQSPEKVEVTEKVDVVESIETFQELQNQSNPESEFKAKQVHMEKLNQEHELEKLEGNDKFEDVEMKSNPEDSEPFYGFVVDLHFNCQVCHKTFRHSRGFKKHKCGKYPEEFKPLPFHCAQCEKGFTDFHDLKCHNINFHKSIYLKCKGCALKYELLEEHLEHQKVCLAPKQLQLKLPKLNSQKIHKCKKCFMTFKFIKGLKKHVKKCQSLGKYEMTNWEKYKVAKPKFDKSDWHNFKVKNPQDPRAAYQCEHCEKCYPTSRNLQRHLLVVHEGRRYTCQVCDLEFKEKYMMKNHYKNVHQGIQQNCEHCEKAFPCKVSLNQHMKTKHGVDDYYKCEECDEGYARKEALMKHVKIVHQESQFFRCSKCHETFLQKQNLFRHEIDVHGESE